jgi:hypothetical protein
VRCATLVITVTIAANGGAGHRIENGIRGEIIFENKSCCWPRHKRRNCICLRNEGELNTNRDTQSGRLNKETEAAVIYVGGWGDCPDNILTRESVFVFLLVF